MQVRAPARTRAPQADSNSGWTPLSSAMSMPLSRRAGTPLDEGLRERFSGRFGVDFSQVRVHADREASSEAASLGARAFTLGADIFFGDGQYAPSTRGGQRLIAHELAHVAQQRGEPVHGLSQAPAGTVQRAQIGGINTGDGGVSYFVYELDDARSSFAALATWYGVTTGAIQSLNPGTSPTRLQPKQQIKVPAKGPPAGPVPPHNGEGGMVVSTGTNGLNVRWSASSDANVLGKLVRGATVTYLGGVQGDAQLVNVPLAALSRRAEGLIAHMQGLGLADTVNVWGWMPVANLRLSNRTPTDNERMDLARMIWGEQNTLGEAGMTCAAWIVRNRYEHGWGATYSAIVSEPNQFQGYRSTINPSDQAQLIAADVISGARPDPTGGQGFYFGNQNGQADILGMMKRKKDADPAFIYRQVGNTNMYWSNKNYAG